jgi:hypothetical protein
LKYLIFSLSIILTTLPSFAADCLNQKDEMKQYWARADGRTQSGGWLFFTGKAAASTPAKAYFKAEGMALTRLVQECRLIHLKTRIIERCDEKVGSSYLAYVRANVTVKDCEKSQQETAKGQVNDKFTKIYNEYDNQQRIERMINHKGESSKLARLKSNLDNLLSQKRTSDVQKEIEKRKKELSLLESKTQKKSIRCVDSIDCLIKGNQFLKTGKSAKASWAYYDGCYVYKDPELCFAYGSFNKVDKKNKYPVYQAFKEACSRNHGEACYELGKWEKSQFKGKEIDAKLSFKLSCNLGFYKGCVERGYFDWVKYNKSGKKKLLDSAENYLKKSCMKLKDALGCLAAYKRIRFSIPTKANKSKVDLKRQDKIRLDLVKFSCDNLKHLPSCHEILAAMKGTSSRLNKKTKRLEQVYTANFKKGIEYTKKNCEQGYGMSCGAYAYYLRDYYKKEEESDKLYDKTCKHFKISFFCNGYAKYLSEQKKHKQALEYYKFSCELHDLHGCVQWGTILEDNMKKKDEAANIYKMACDKNSGLACGRYGHYIAENLNDPVRGLAFTKKGCYYKNLDGKNTIVSYNSPEACVYRARIEVQKYKKIAQYKNVLKYHCNSKFLRKKAKDMACELYEEISN